MADSATNSAAVGGGSRRAIWVLVRLAVGIGLLVYLAHSRLIDFGALGKLLTAWPVTLAGLALILADIFCMSLRLCWLFRPQGLRLSLRSSLELNLVSSFFATFLPGAAGGDLSKLYYAARENNGRRAEIVTTIAFDRFVGLFSLLLLPLLFAPFFGPLIHGVRILQLLVAITAALGAALLAGFLLCLFQRDFMLRVAQRTSRFLPGRELPERAIRTISGYSGYTGILLAALTASLVANLTMIAAAALAIWLLSPANLSWRMCLVIPMGDVANSLPITPGGLGVGETAFNALFRVAGLGGGAEALLCWRIWRTLLSLTGLGIYLRGIRGNMFSDV